MHVVTNKITLSHSINEDRDLQNGVAGLGEVLLDYLLAENGLAKDIPFLGTVLSFGRFGRNISDQILINKIKPFLTHVHSVPHSKRVAIIRKIHSSEKYKVRVGEKLLYIIDASEDHAAADILGQMFQAVLEEKLTYDDFLQASRALRTIGTENFLSFVQSQQEHWELEGAGQLLAAGLLDQSEPELEFGRERHNGSLVKGLKHMRPRRSALGAKLQNLFRYPTP